MGTITDKYGRVWSITSDGSYTTYVCEGITIAFPHADADIALGTMESMAPYVDPSVEGTV